MNGENKEKEIFRLIKKREEENQAFKKLIQKLNEQREQKIKSKKRK